MYRNEAIDEVRHYTQMMWADSYHIGCSSSSFTDPVKHPEKTAIVNVCNYGPKGNTETVSRDPRPWLFGNPVNKTGTRQLALQANVLREQLLMMKPATSVPKWNFR